MKILPAELSFLCKYYSYSYLSKIKIPISVIHRQLTFSIVFVFLLIVLPGMNILDRFFEYKRGGGPVACRYLD